MSLLKGAAAITLALVAGYSLTSRPTRPPANKPTTVAPADPAPNPEKDPNHWHTPTEANDADRAVMLDWYATNEICRGSNVTADSRPCKTRDEDEDVLRERGWCWEYEDPNVFPYDFGWHPCSRKSIYADYKGAGASRSSGGDDVAEAESPAASTLSAEQKDNLPGLARYESLIEPAVSAEALYEANQQCTGQPGWEGRDSLQEQMRYINTRYFPREPGLWVAAGKWAQQTLDAKVIADKRRVCVTFDPR